MTEIRTKDGYYNLVLKWAPIHYQYIDVNHLGRDLLCRVNFDCNWDTSNNRQMARKIDSGEEDKKMIERMVPVCYYSVAENTSHLFILYSFYHAYDERHENDLEGCMLIIEKGTAKNELLGMLTIAHLQFRKYSYKNRLLDSNGNELYKLRVEEEEDDEIHPLVEQEHGGHGLYALGGGKFYAKFRRWLRYVINRPPDIVVYFPVYAKNPEDINTVIQAVAPNRSRIGDMGGTPNYATYYYKLVDMLDPAEGLWHQRDNPETFHKGAFNSSKRPGEAHAPWKWDDKFDNFGEGLIWTDPAKLVAGLFKLNDKDKDREPWSIDKRDIIKQMEDQAPNS